jgi:CDP-glycerol glycerophosphotransferase
MSGKSFGDSPRILYDAISNDPFFKEYRLIWAFEQPDRFLEYKLNTIKLNSLSYFTTALSSSFWITNSSIERGLSFKSKKTIHLNTWHGIPIKVVGNGYKNRNDYDYSDVDFMCYSGEFEREIYIKGFNVRPENLKMCGMPRNDVLYIADSAMKSQLMKQLGISENKKVILYAPTFRDVGKNSVDVAIKPPLDFTKWEKVLGKTYIVLCRMHYHTTELLGVAYSDFVINVTDVVNICDLYIISDILISDYSSSIIDFTILERPIISYAYDKDDYAEREGLFIPLDEALPGMVFETEDELLKHIVEMDENEQCKKAKAVKNKYIQSSGNATKECIKFIKSKAR